MSFYFLIPFCLSVIYCLGTIYGPTAHDRTYYQSFYELFIQLTAFYIAPLGSVSLFLTVGLLISALALIFIIRWVIGEEKLVSTGRFLQINYPFLYYFCEIVKTMSFILLTPYFLPIRLYHHLQLIIPVLVLLVERVAIFLIHKRMKICEGTR